MSEQLKVTSIKELEKQTEGKIVELPGWDEKPFVCRLKRISMLGLIKGGKIPNALLQSAQGVFMDGAVTGDANFKEMTEIFSIFVKYSLLEPTASDLDDLGLDLTDEQMITIFNYSQNGVEAVKKFRSVKTGDAGNKSK